MMLQFIASLLFIGTFGCASSSGQGDKQPHSAEGGVSQTGRYEPREEDIQSILALDGKITETVTKEIILIMSSGRKQITKLNGAAQKLDQLISIQCHEICEIKRKD